MTTPIESLVVPVPEGADLAVRVRGLRRSYGSTRDCCDGIDLDVVLQARCSPC